MYPNPAINFFNLNPEEIISFFSSSDHRQLRHSCRLCDKLFNELVHSRFLELQVLSEAYHLFEQLKRRVLDHLSTEEQFLFPYAMEILADKSYVSLKPEKLMVGLLKTPLESMNKEHTDILSMLNRLRLTMKNYIFDEQYSDKMRLLCAELFTLEQSMMWHFYIQENVLYPKLRDRENELINKNDTL